MIQYNIWKIVGCGRKQNRYYESYKQFKKWFDKWQIDPYWKKIDWKAFRFTSRGWEEIKR